MRSFSLLLLVVVAATSTAGCAGPKVSRTIAMTHVGTKYARLTGYFATAKAAPGGRHEEDVPGNLQHDLILDEATLMKLVPTETCVSVTVRTESDYDEPLEQLAPACSVAGRNGPVMVEDERVTVTDYSFTGMQPVVLAEGILADAYAGLSIAAPSEQVFRVVTRQGTICCAVGGTAGTVGFSLDNSRREIADWSYKLAFEWNVR